MIENEAPLDQNQNEICNAVIQRLESDPSTAVEGQLWYRNDLHRPSVKDGTVNQLVAWVSDFESAPLSTLLGTLGTLTNVAIAATDTIKQALEKLQGQVNARASLTGNPDFRSSTYPPLRASHIGRTTNAATGPLQLVGESTTDRGDGFGARVYFAMKDDGLANPSDLGFCGAARNGADNTGKVEIGVKVASVDTIRLTVENDHVSMAKGLKTGTVLNATDAAGTIPSDCTNWINTANITVNRVWTLPTPSLNKELRISNNGANEFYNVVITPASGHTLQQGYASLQLAGGTQTGLKGLMLIGQSDTVWAIVGSFYI